MKKKQQQTHKLHFLNRDLQLRLSNMQHVSRFQRDIILHQLSIHHGQTEQPTHWHSCGLYCSYLCTSAGRRAERTTQSMIPVNPTFPWKEETSRSLLKQTPFEMMSSRSDRPMMGYTFYRSFTLVTPYGLGLYRKHVIFVRTDDAGELHNHLHLYG